MQIDLDTLPDDPALLQQMLRDVVAAAALRQAALQGCVQEREAENDKLRLLIQRLLRQQFGRRSERLDPDQLQLGLEDLEQAIAEGEAAQDAAAQSDEQRRQRHAVRPRRNHGALPAHLPRHEVVIDVDIKEKPPQPERRRDLAARPSPADPAEADEPALEPQVVADREAATQAELGEVGVPTH